MTPLCQQLLLVCHWSSDFWQLSVFVFQRANNPPWPWLQLHFALAWLIFSRCSGCMLHDLPWWRLLTTWDSFLLLVGHYVSGEDPLLSLFSFKFEGCQGTQLLIHSSWRRVLRRTYSTMVVLVTIHCCVHVSSGFNLFLDLWTMLSTTTTISWM